MSANAVGERRAAGWIGYDWAKLIVAIILILLLLWLTLSGQGAGPETAAPLFSTPAQEAAVPAGTVTFSGTGAPGSQVAVTVDGARVGAATVGADGTWSIDAEVTGAGPKVATVSALDASGQPAPGLTPGARSFTVTESAAAAPEIVRPVLQAPAAGASVEPGTVTFSGAGTPGSQVEVVVDGSPVGTATVGGDGRWSLEAEVAEAGERSVIVNALDASGQPITTILPQPSSFTVAEPAASAPAIDTPRMSAPAQGASVPAGTVTFSGAGTPGSQVEVVVDGSPVGVATVAADGSWTLDAEVSGAGQKSVVLRALDASGQATGAMPAAGSFSVTEPAATTPLVPAITSLADGDSPGAGMLPIGGTGEPGSTVQILNGDQVIGTVKVGADGTWVFDYAAAAGDYVFGVRPAGDAGAPPATVRVTVTSAAAETGGSGASGGTGASAAPPAITSLASGDAVTAGTVTIAGSGAPGSTVEILNGDQVIGTATVGADGSWSFDYDAKAGTYVLSARAAGGAAGDAVSISVSEAAASGGTGTAASSGTSGAGGATNAADTPAALPNTGGEEVSLLLAALAAGLFAAGGTLRAARRR